MKSGSQNWSKHLKTKASELNGRRGDYDAAALDKMVAEQSVERLNRVLKGIERFVHAKAAPAFERPDAIWEVGSARLVPYGDVNSQAMICVPSLINRSSIFDLQEGHSFVRFLAEQGVNPYILDWGEPSGDESGFDVSGYVTDRLIPAIEFLYEKTGKPVQLVGYCMGGIMALAATQHLGDKVDRLACIATPWDFKASDVMRLPEDVAYDGFMEGLFARRETVSGQLVHQLLYMMNPWAVHGKYTRFAEMEAGSDVYHSFMAREGWLHDEVAMTPESAQTCFVDWARSNMLHEQQWQVNGEVLNPKLIDRPCFVAIAEYDRVVPPACAMPLAAYLRNRIVVEPPSGHIGLVAGLKAKEHLWIPLANWLKTV